MSEVGLCFQVDVVMYCLPMITFFLLRKMIRCVVTAILLGAYHNCLVTITVTVVITGQL